MSTQLVSERKTRRAARETGLPIERCLAHHNHWWLCRATIDGEHFHVAVNPKTWEVEPDELCWTSCDTPRRSFP